MSSIALSVPQIGDAEIAAAVRVLRGGHIVQGSEAAAFEAEFADLVAGRECVAVSSGTAALHLALLALGIGYGQEVIVPAFTFGATAHAVGLTGAKPVFADIDPHTYCIDPAHVESLINNRTAAVIPVHLFGHPADMPAIQALAARHGLAVVEDAAQAVAASLNGTPVGAFGDLSCFSFYPTKNMHSIEGGMIATADAALASKLRLLRNQGMTSRYHYELVGLNARMTDVAAAVGRVQLRRLAGYTAARRANAAWLGANLRGLVMPRTALGAEHVFHQYVVRDRRRDHLVARLRSAQIETDIHYPVPLHRSLAYQTNDSLPHSEAAAHEVLSLPVHPGLQQRDLSRIATVVNE